MSDPSAATPFRRTRGRPAKLSPALILQAAGEVLADCPPDQLTLSRVAEQLSAPATSVYNYFPNRGALLSALAESLFNQFEEPAPSVSWAEGLAAWMRALDAFLLRHPVALKVITGPDGETSPAWGHVRAPLFGCLRQAGFGGRELAAVSTAVHTLLVGFLFALPYVIQPRPQDPQDLPPARSHVEREEAEMRAFRPEVRRQELLEFAVQAILGEVRRRLPA